MPADTPVGEALAYVVITRMWLLTTEPLRAGFERTHGRAMRGEFRLRVLMTDGGAEVIKGTWGEELTLVRAGRAKFSIDNHDGGIGKGASVRPRELV